MRAAWRVAQRARAGAWRCDTAAWGCDTAGGSGHDTAPVRACAHLGVLAGLCVHTVNLTCFWT